MSAYRFIAARKAADPAFPIAIACDALTVSTSGYYDWHARQDRPPTAAERRRVALTAAIRRIHADSHGRYGAPRVHAELRDEGWRVGENTVAAIMAALGLQGRCGRDRRPRTTRPAAVAPEIPDLVQRNFTADAPNRLWCTDLTYVPTAQGWLYLVVIIDVYSRRVVGWAAAAHMRAELMVAALTMAVGARQPAPGLIVHSDRGSQYTSDDWLAALDDIGARASMGRVGWCWDNSLAEAWFATFKNELVHPIGAYTTRRIAHLEIARYIRWHNHQRRHSALDQTSPADYEAAHTPTATTMPLAA